MVIAVMGAILAFRSGKMSQQGIEKGKALVLFCRPAKIPKIGKSFSHVVCVHKVIQGEESGLKGSVKVCFKMNRGKTVSIRQRRSGVACALGNKNQRTGFGANGLIFKFILNAPASSNGKKIILAVLHLYKGFSFLVKGGYDLCISDSFKHAFLPLFSFSLLMVSQKGEERNRIAKFVSIFPYCWFISIPFALFFAIMKPISRGEV